MLNVFLAELGRRFSQENIKIMKSIQASNPDSEHFLDHTHLKAIIAVTYHLDYNLLSIESTLAKHTLGKADMETVGDVLHELAPLRAAFPTLTHSRM